MRFVEWNCCAGIASKLPLLADMEAGRAVDLAVLCEVPAKSPSETFGGREVYWHANLGRWSKGVAVVSFGTPLTPAPVPAGAGSLSVAATTASGIGVLGIWSVPSARKQYIAEVQASVDAYSGWLRSTPSIVAGDFNVQMGRSLDQRGGRFAAIVEQFGDLGYVSAYHHLHPTDTFGAETEATYFHRRQLDQPWHLDYVFMHTDLLDGLDVTVGRFEQWVSPQRGFPKGASDHVPLVVDIDASAA